MFLTSVNIYQSIVIHYKSSIPCKSMDGEAIGDIVHCCEIVKLYGRQLVDTLYQFFF